MSNSLKGKIFYKIRKLYNGYFIKKTVFPKFSNDEIVNKNMVFSGYVQNIGFRYQLTMLAREIDLVGWVKNLDNGDVEAEIQGTEERINFLVEEIRKRPKIEFEIIREKYNKVDDKLKEFSIIY